MDARAMASNTASCEARAEAVEAVMPLLGSMGTLLSWSSPSILREGCEVCEMFVSVRRPYMAFLWVWREAETLRRANALQCEPTQTGPGQQDIKAWHMLCVGSN